MDDLNDLIIKSQKGDKDSFGEIYQLFYKRIYRYCLVNLNYDEQLSQDICQETFLKAWKSIKSFSSFEGGSFQAFLFRIARNLMIDHSRKKSEISLENFGDIEDKKDHEEDLDRETEQAKVRKVIENLDEAEKQIIILRYFEELSTSEVAKVLNIKDGALRVRIHRVLKKLKDEMVKINGR